MIPSELTPRLRGQGFTPERLIAPHTIPVEEQQTQPAGEKLIENLLEKADAAVVIGEPSFLSLYRPWNTDTAILASPSAKHLASSPTRRILSSACRSNEGSECRCRFRRTSWRGELRPLRIMAISC